MSKRRMTILPVGYEIGGVRIIHALNHSDRAHELLYQIQYTCCGLMYRLSHQAVIQRGQNHARFCPSCNGKQGRHAPRKQKQGPEVWLVDELPVKPKRVPSAESILTLWDRANARVGMRQGARG